MRITGGKLKGRIIAVPAGIIRPAMDRMRESIFSCLGNIAGLSFLDIFSGSGIIALEAASRGACPVEAVEQDKLKRRTLLENVSISPCRINCRFMPAELYVKRAKSAFDIIFMDPPFPYHFKWELTAKIAESPIVKDGTKILIHRPRNDNLTEEINNLTKIDSREYGRSIVDFFVKKADNIGNK
ncbi:MAG: RsmD family RNA methyltransferase [Treponema sp.]|nr:RsmD family RNA methyltransferase [Treponema sp.]